MNFANFRIAYYFDGNQGGFWIGYKGQETCIFDEFSGAVLPPKMFQRVADKYPLWLPVKGGEEPCRIQTVHICSNYLPHQWWSEKTQVCLAAIYRRIVEVHWHYDFKKVRRFVSEEGHLENVEKTAMYKFEISMSENNYVQPVNIVK